MDFLPAAAPDFLVIHRGGNHTKKKIVLDMEVLQILVEGLPLIQARTLVKEDEKTTGHKAITPVEVNEIICRRVIVAQIQLGTFRDLTKEESTAPWDDAAVLTQAPMISFCRTSISTVKSQRKNNGKIQNSIETFKQNCGERKENLSLFYLVK
ncbi:Oidioi.mRNA.OKI2018_I69.chr2.g6878.t1.cds [Oikopleura dioica]|uniref:Oidioi.mRNA.OKI2018_I69.chr2.g6878.t1.cds n=1 Tax=Oikopleura dioica TaxID=34765 RepID=A0ABN7TAZ1_OIKDI|nr:Oidioi.mRNA.OKI2018_I69.chr2.g6878.t1.cds [Oikopleura dioica]